MKTLKTLLFAGVILSALTLVVSFGLGWSFESKAVLAQRVQPSEADALFGDLGTLLGEPAMYIINDRSAFLEGETESGALLIDQNYLDENGIYPLQLQTVQFSLGQVRLGAGIALILTLGGLWILRRHGLPSTAPTTA